MALPPALQNRLRLPVVGAPLFIISNPDLVIAQCKAGIVGSFPALNARPEPVLEEWLERITSELADHDAANPDAPSAPFAVNQIVHGSNARLKHDMDMCVKYEVPIVITSLGAKEWVNEMVHSYGGIVLHDVINNRFAKKAIEKGADGLIAVAAGRRTRRHNVSNGTRSGNPGMVRWPPPALWCDRNRRRSAGLSGNGRRSGVHRVCVYRHRRGRGGASIQTSHRRLLRR